MSRITLTVAAPEAHRDDATQMGILHGWAAGQTPEEWEQAFSSQWQDAGGNLYRVFSLPVARHVIDQMIGALQSANLERPPFDADNLINMAAANRAHDLLRGNVWPTQDPPEPMPQADPSRIVAVVGLRGVEALASIGLGPVALGQ
jgi:hypothetical protein